MTPGAILSIIRTNIRHCPGCRYDVTAAMQVICPECGRDLTDDAAIFLERQANDYPQRYRLDALAVLPNAAVFLWMLASGSLGPGPFGYGIQPAFVFFVITVPSLVVGLTLVGSGTPHPGQRAMQARILIAAAWIWPILVVIACRYL